MSSHPHEGFPTRELAQVVTLEEARTEVSDTIESLVIKSLEKAEKLSVDSIIDISPFILSQQEIPEDKINDLTVRGKDIYKAINKLRQAKLILAGGIRDNATNTELVVLVDELEKWNQWWKTYVDEEIKDANSLTMVVGNSAYALQKKLVIDGKSLLSDSALQKLQELESEDRKHRPQ